MERHDVARGVFDGAFGKDAQHAAGLDMADRFAGPKRPLPVRSMLMIPAHCQNHSYRGRRMSVAIIQRTSNGQAVCTSSGSTPAVWLQTTTSGPGSLELGMFSRPVNFTWWYTWV